MSSGTVVRDTRDLAHRGMAAETREPTICDRPHSSSGEVWESGLLVA